MLINCILAIVVLSVCEDQSAPVSQLSKTPISRNWTFSSGTQPPLPAEVPGVVHLDLIRNKKIKDPFYRLNEHDVQWIDKQDWIYQTQFSVPPADLAKDHLELEFLGLDTYAKVYVNDVLLLESDNMFRTYRVDIKSVAKQQNSLKVVFESPIAKGIQKYDQLGYTIPVSDNDLASIGKVAGEKKVSIFTRKAGYHFGWDWGPRLVSSGIWRPVHLLAWDDVKINSIFVQQESLNKEVAEVSVAVELAPIQQNLDTEVQLYVNDELVESADIVFKADRPSGKLAFEIRDPQLWWPNGMGSQTLYDVKVKVRSQKSADEASTRIGFRTIEVVQEPDAIGKSFYFKVNGVPTFMKGANYIPQDVFLPRVGDAEYDHILNSAKAANMNMLRVWGGGIYENDEFYDKCDELGLLVWQDFMFACAMFPGDGEFLDNVRQEAIDNVKRIRNHPSIALWCGNNEILSAWENWGWKDKVTREQSAEVASKIGQAYQDIFHRVLPEVVSQYDGRRFYWHSSPQSDHGVPENFEKGDAHYWMVWWGKEPFDNYNQAIPRFMSEYGFQSFPNMPTIRRYAIESDFDIYSEVMKSHQRSSIGNATIDEYLRRHFRQPKDFESFIYTSQLLQAHGIRIGIEAHRRNRPRCMGSLYWQINDCWPVASWSSIDYHGNWKALHYQVKRSFADVILSLEADQQQVKVHVISDRQEDFDAVIDLSLVDFSGEVIKQWRQQVTVAENASNVLYTIGNDAFDWEKYSETAILFAEISQHGKPLDRYILNLKPFKDLKLKNPEIKIDVAQSDESFIITLEANAFAKGVYLSDGSVRNFSDNYFDMMPGSKKQVTIKKPDGVGREEFQKKLKVISLFDTY